MEPLIAADAPRDVSVVVPVFNAVGSLERAVASAVAQEATLEVILVDDASSDGSLELCRQLSARDPERVRLLEQPGNRGPGAARNLAARAARGALLAFLDADDFMLSDRFSCSLPLLEGDPSIDGVWETVEVVFSSPELERVWIDGGHPLVATLSPPPEARELLAALLEPARELLAALLNRAVARSTSTASWCAGAPSITSMDSTTACASERIPSSCGGARPL